MFRVRTFLVPSDRVSKSYVTEWFYYDLQSAMHTVGHYLQRGHVVEVRRPASDMFPEDTVVYTLDLHEDPEIDEIVNNY